MKIVELDHVVALRTFCPVGKMADAIRVLVKEAETRDLVIHGIWLDAIDDTKDEFEVVLFGT